jgi:hypothetical protein
VSQRGVSWNHLSARSPELHARNPSTLLWRFPHVRRARAGRWLHRRTAVQSTSEQPPRDWRTLADSCSCRTSTMSVHRLHVPPDGAPDHGARHHVTRCSRARTARVRRRGATWSKIHANSSRSTRRCNRLAGGAQTARAFFDILYLPCLFRCSPGRLTDGSTRYR